MRRWKNVCSAARCSANSRSTKEGFGSAADMAMHEIVPHLYMSASRPKRPPLFIQSEDGDLEVSISPSEDSLSMNRTIQLGMSYENRRRIDDIRTCRGRGEPRSRAFRGARDPGDERIPLHNCRLPGFGQR